MGADGVYTVQQSFHSINYQDTRGAWQPISNTLVAAAPALAAQGFTYQNKANDYTVAFAASSGGAALERITRHGVTLDLSPTGAQATGDSALAATLPLSLTSNMTAATPTAMSATSSAPVAPATVMTPTATGAITDVATPMSATMSMSPQVGAPIVADDAITYTNLYTATDAVYNVRDDAVKESLILRDASAPSSFTFAVRVDGARPHMTGPSEAPGARTAFLDAAGREQLALEPLVAVDARGATTPVSLTLSPVIGAGIGGAVTFQLRATIPSAWLADPARVWPVALDPSVGLPLTQLVTINSGNGGLILYSRLCPPNTSPTCPDQQRLLYHADLIGNQGPTGNPAITSTVGRDLLQFDLSPLPPHVTLLRAYLRAVVLDQNGNAPYGGGYPVHQTMNASVYPLTASWIGNTTWTTCDGSTPWATPGGDYDASYRVTTSVDYSQGMYGDTLAAWNMTPLVRQWYLGTRPNNGVLVKMDDEQTFSPRGLDWLTWAPNGLGGYYHSFGNGSGANGLEVMYSYIPWQGGAAPGGARAFDPHAALKSDRSLITFPQGDGQQMGVNVANGDLEIMRNDVSLPGVGLPNVVQRTFHSAASISQTTTLGHQWQLSVGSDTALFTQPTGDAIYLDPTGQGYDIPTAISSTVSAVVTDTATQGNWAGAYGQDGYILNAWQGGGDLQTLPPYVSGYRVTSGQRVVWQRNSSDRRALQSAVSTSYRNAAALTASAPPTQTQQVATFNARTLITASVYLLNWAGSIMSETVQLQDAAGTHSYYAAGAPANNGLWVRFTNLQVGPTQPLTVTVTGDPGSTAASSALTFDGSAPNGFARAPGLPADLTQQADGTYLLTFNNGLSEQFSSSGQYSGASDRHGNTERYLYNGGAGGSCPTTQIGAIVDTVGRTTTFSCNGGGLVTGIADPDNRSVSYGYDGSNNLTSYTDRAGGVTHYGYNATGLPVTITDPIGNQTVITYDASLRVGAVQDGAGSVTSFTYGLSATNTTTVTNALNAQTIYTYDPATGAMLSLTDPNGNVTHSTYDANMELLTTTDPLGHVITNTTTGGSDQTGSVDPLGIGTGTAYNALHEPVVITDTQGQQTTTQYNALGDPITITDPLSYTTIMTPAANGLALARTDGNGHTTRYGYDAFGDTIAVIDALNRVSTMVYDTNIGRLSAVTDPKLQTTTLGYDGEDRLLQTSYQDHSVTQNLIDADGNVIETVDSAGATLFKYDGDNRPIQQTYPDGTVVSYSYDAAGRLQTKSEPGLPTTTYGYDPGGRLKTVSNSLLGQFTYSYDAASRLTALGDPNGITTTYTLDNDNRVTGISEAKGANTLLSDSFSYIKPGGGMGSQRMAETRTDSGVGSQWTYSYDADARLTGATVSGGTLATYRYGYDAVGNMTSNNGVAQRYDADNQITAAGAITYTFDNNGNQTGTSESGLPRWRYDAQNHTIGYTGGLATNTFTVDGGMQRRQKTTTTGGTTTSGVFDGDMYRQLAPVSRTLYYVRDPSGRLLALTDGGTVYYYGLDGHGSVANLTDKNGNVVNTYRYDPYGNSLSKTERAILPNPWQYAGGYFDAESGLYLLGARYYAPQLGRFLQQDPLGSGNDSQYAYAGSDPCNNSDPTGMTTCYHHVTPQQAGEMVDFLNEQIAQETGAEALYTAVGLASFALGGPAGAAIGIIAGLGDATILAWIIHEHFCLISSAIFSCIFILLGR